MTTHIILAQTIHLSSNQMCRQPLPTQDTLKTNRFQVPNVELKQGLRWKHESVTSSPFSKLWLANRPTNQPDGHDES